MLCSVLRESGVLARRFTEADLRMYPTIIRYDGCYATLFKCSKKRISDYPNLSAWLRDIHQLTVKDSPTLQVSPLACPHCQVPPDL